MTTYILKQQDGQYFTEPILSTEEWLRVLHATDEKNGRQLDVLRKFLYRPGHKGTCAKVSKEFSMSSSGISMLVQQFGKFAQKNCGKEFRIESSGNPNDRYWPITMVGRYIDSGHFEWELRPELVSALRRFLIERLLEAYRGVVVAEGLDSSRSDELYKWKFLSSVKGKSTEEIVRGLVSKECNFIEKPHAGATLISLLQSVPEAVSRVFETLLQDKPMDDRLRDFNEAAKIITPSGKSSFGDERTAAAFLACIDPQQYTPYTSTIYETYCNYLGITSKYAGRKYSHFLTLLDELIPIEQQDQELLGAIHQEIDTYFWSDRLNAQDILWQMKVYMEKSLPKNWLQQIYDEALLEKNGCFVGWYQSYKESVIRFQDMFSEGKTATDVSEDTIDLFIRTQSNGIYNNGQGCYTYEEYPKIREMWPEVYGVLKRNYDSGEIDSDDFKQLEESIRPALKKNRPLPYHRLWSAIFPEKLTTCCLDKDFAYVYDETGTFDESLPSRSGDWLEDNQVFMDYLGKMVKYVEPWHRAIFARYLFDNIHKYKVSTNNSGMEKYINILKANHNIVLTGAPGTGKTYLARQIAEQMGDDNPAFVQFHPSYDYTDFVEGLRPNGENSFERVNGVFKQFCIDALSRVDTDVFDKAYNLLLSDLMKMDEPLKLKTPSIGATYAISINKKGNLNLHTGLTLEKQGTLTRENVRSHAGNVDIDFDWKGYYDGVVQLLKEKYGLTNVSPKEVPSARVFIIDEINRGELSKIFGELFFAIDPDYRGPEHTVKTQYQNLIEPGDPFEKGFYVPENVYIIGTMNDIDRGVESMDLAIRRRFAWVEVKAEDRASMLGEEISQWAAEAKTRMMSLNKALKKEGIGLTDAYDIGPAYFLKVKRYEGDFEQLWEYHIKGILYEYFRGTRGIEDKIKLLKSAYDNYQVEA